MCDFNSRTVGARISVRIQVYQALVQTANRAQDASVDCTLTLHDFVPSSVAQAQVAGFMLQRSWNVHGTVGLVAATSTGMLLR